MRNLTKTQIEQALDKISEWFPEEAESIGSNKEQLIDCIVNNKILGVDHPLLLVKHSISTEQELIELPKFTPCEEACGIVSFDVVIFVFGLVGLHVSNQERLTRELLRELGQDTLRGLARAIHNFSVAKSATNKAKELFAIMGGIWKAGGFRVAFKVIKHEMCWWEWVKTGAIAVAQITSWIATDGVAFIAEAALSIMGAEQLIEDSAQAVNVCGII